VLGLWAGNEVARQTESLPQRLSQQVGTLLEVAVIFSVTVTVSNALTTLVQGASERRALARPITGLGQSVVRGVVFIIGLLVLLGALGIQITPILTALGVGGLAVALALQDTLSNLFAGVHLLADKPIRVGDYVKLADSIEGHVVDIGWRSTRVRMLQNVVVTIPNKRVAESTITNYDMPESRMALPIRVAVDYGADPDLVQRLLLEEAAQATSEVPGLLAEPAPTARLIPGFGEFSLDFTLVCHVKSFTDQFVVQHELRRRILHRFAREGVRIPVQVRGAELRSVGGDARG
jgi:small-conductance mechanosensitive channel